MRKKGMNRRQFMKTVGAASLAGAGLATGFPVFGRAEKLDEVEIALLLPMTGGLAFIGRQEEQGWEIAADEINAAGGIKSLGGAKLKGVIHDTQGTPRIAMSEVEKAAMNKKIPMLVGCWSSACTYPASQVAEQYKFPMMIDIGSQTDILRRGFKYVWRYISSTEKTCASLVDFAVQTGKKFGLAPKTAAMINRDDSYGKDVANSSMASFAKAGIKLVENITYPGNTTNLDVEVAKIKSVKPDLIYAAPFLSDGVLLTRALYNQKVEALSYIFQGGINNPEYFGMVGDMAQYICMQNNVDSSMHRKVDQDFAASLKKRYNVIYTQNSAALYGIAYVIADALERAASIEREAIRTAMTSTDIKTGPATIIAPLGVKFDSRGENLNAMTFVCQCHDKKWETVWPFDWPSAKKMVYPKPVSKG
jgi:branched-chain amino acid transport system substrate-binding protein